MRDYGKTKECMVSLSEKCQKQQMKLRKADLKVETKAMLCVTQEQVIQTNYQKHKIDKTGHSPLCRLCDKKNETISQIVRKYQKGIQEMMMLPEYFIGNCVGNTT